MRKIIIITSFIVVMVVLFVVFLRSKPNVYIDSSPSVALISIDNKRTKNISQQQPGKHTLVVSYKGFETYRRTIEVPPSGKLEYVVVLNPNSSVGSLWLKNRPKEQAQREGLGSKLSSQISKDIEKALPVAAELPHVDNLFRVDISDNKSKKTYVNDFALKVEYYGEEGKKQATDWLKFKKVDESTTVYYIDALAKP